MKIVRKGLMWIEYVERRKDMRKKKRQVTITKGKARFKRTKGKEKTPYIIALYQKI